MRYTLVRIPQNPNWQQICAQIKASENDVMVGSGTDDELIAAAEKLAPIAHGNPAIGILAGAALKLFLDLPANTEFPADKPRMFSCGRQIITPLGLSAERINLNYGDAFYPTEDVGTKEAQSFWGTTFFIKKEALQKIDGPDAAYISNNAATPLPPNIIWDDLALQVLLAGYKIHVTTCVTATVAPADVEFPNPPHSAYEHWEKKWHWNPLVPNAYHIRGKWQGTPIGEPLIQRLLDPWPCEQPPVDLIMLTGNSLPNLQRCLGSLAKTKYPHINFHVFLNGSSSDVVAYLETLKASYPFPIETITSPVNLGIPVALNWLHTRCTAPLVARLDDDMEMPENWLAELVEGLRQFPLAGAILPSMIHPATVPGQPDDPVVPLRLRPHFPGVPSNLPPPPYRQTYATNFLGGACVVFRKKAIDLAGGYDIRFTPTQNDDIDYGIAIRALGYDLVVLGKVVSLHHASSFPKAPFERALGIGYQSAYFCHKWGRAREILELSLDRDGRIIG